LTRKIVLFEFTGIHCPNCWEGHVAVDEIDSVFYGHVIPISIHAGGFAVPSGNDPDFRTPFGDQLYESLINQGVPSILFGSMDGDSIQVGSPSSWLGELGQMLPAYSKFVIEPTISFTNNSISAIYEITERESVASELRFYGLIVEDHIEGPQANVEEDPYDHRHVFRKCFTSLSGNRISFDGGTTSMSFNVEVDESWNLDNIYVIGIIVDANTKVIYTGEQRKLFE
jgi:hypothetical protein